ncbi:uncharacterized protein K444DRAFT_630217 [Hyaloscypha bicolor E]|uniref:Uncharacterized protein n=1 Tax=Hyaloscypha bicolor E TaxID=1095630 RepID=A0A2J6T8T2_9HELO|nr:uncharacterized protein K444DRAFT_630217 [Hyaloscypha bicolor E]PMD59439.1 hypothetical protein K444DRAFT_630217 [Hyaloscypha bicolor E]
MSAAPYMAPSTRNYTRNPEQGVQTPSSGTQIIESIKIISANQPTKSGIVKLKDSDTLTDGASPSFKNWRIQIKDKFLINSRIFNSEQAKIAYIFNRTADITQKYLAPCYRKGPEPFITAIEIVMYLAEILENLFEA